MSDEQDRRAIRNNLAETIFVEAGAGTGKTSALVARVVNLVTSGTCPISGLAAITFTEAAAAELRDRIRQGLEAAARSDEPEAAARAREGIDQLDAAAISTLHSFAQRILSEFPLEAGLPPIIEVRDELQSTVEFTARWASFVRDLLIADEHADTVARALLCGLNHENLQVLAKRLDDNWDMLEGVRRDPPALVRIDARAVVEALEQVLPMRSICTDPDDKLLAHLDALEDLPRHLRDAAGDEMRVLAVLLQSPKLAAGRIGHRGNWDGHVEEVRDLLDQAKALLGDILGAVRTNSVERLTCVVADEVVRAADERRRSGSLQFHDLLVLARRLLRTSPRVAGWLSERYQRLLIDEFQDTDPIQAELAVRLAAGGRDGATGAAEAWEDLAFEAGRLFFVGDAKQSIYRFRRANIALFLTVRDRLPVERRALTRNFRSVPHVLDFVNEVFGTLIGDGVPGQQPEYQALEGDRPEHRSGPSEVVVLGEGREGTVGEIRDIEMADIAAMVSKAVAEQWPVADGRPARLEDIVILLPSRTALGDLQDALDDLGVPYRIESSGLAYATREVSDLLAVLRAVDDPTNEVAVVAALRSAVFGCGDDDLLTWRTAEGRWDYRDPAPDELTDHPVTAAMDLLRQLHAGRWWTDVSSLVELVLRDLRFLELACANKRPRDVWRRLRFVADQARAWGDAAGSDLRGFLGWVDLQIDENTRVVESLLPETDDDAVRIMTIHAAKGLEFPVTVLTGLNVKPPNSASVDVRWTDEGRPAVKVGAGFTSAGYEALAERESEMDHHERVRLLYVAATRARDHLIVSLWHKEGDHSAAATLADLLTDSDVVQWRGVVAGEQPASPDGPREASALSDLDVASFASERDAWLDRRRELLQADERSPVVAATAVAKLSAGGAEILDEPAEEVDAEAGPDDEPPPWRRGRAATAIGRAVHGTLQLIDLASGDGLEATAAAQAAAEGVPEAVDDIVKLARAALDSEVVRAAVQGGRYWREIYVATPVGDRALEGFIDLLVERDDGLHVVDYKSDAARTDDDLDAAVERYRLQGAAYALAVEEAVGRPVTGVSFLFLRHRQAVERRLGDLAGAKGDVRRLLSNADPALTAL